MTLLHVVVYVSYVADGLITYWTLDFHLWPNLIQVLLGFRMVRMVSLYMAEEVTVILEQTWTELASYIGR